MLKKEIAEVRALKKALLVSASEQSASSLSKLLKVEGYDKISAFYAAYSAKEAVVDSEFDLICINAPLIDENGIELSRHFARTTRSSVVIIVPQKNADEVQQAFVSPLPAVYRLLPQPHAEGGKGERTLKGHGWGY